MPATLTPKRQISPLSKAELHALFADEFTTAGGSWQVEVRTIELDSQTISGNVLLDGKRVGRFMRIVVPDSAMVFHLSLGLDEHAQRCGFSATWIERCRERYRAVGIRFITVCASGAGSAVWASMGFTVTDRQWQKLLDEASELDGAETDILDMLRGETPRLMDLADVMAAGRSVLEQVSWDGYIAA